MTRTAGDQFILTCSELVNTEIGQRFLAGLAVQVEESREQLVMAPPEHLQYAQGVARQGTVLLRQLRESPARAKKIIQAEETAALKAKGAQT
jgi:hypothetical protein